jgi:hypothetical protein
MTINQEMTPIDEKIRYKNAPSEASEQAHYNQGYRDGLIKALEQIKLGFGELKQNYVDPWEALEAVAEALSNTINGITRARE